MSLSLRAGARLAEAAAAALFSLVSFGAAYAWSRRVDLDQELVFVAVAVLFAGLLLLGCTCGAVLGWLWRAQRDADLHRHPAASPFELRVLQGGRRHREPVRGADWNPPAA